jgi:hypothetical protein
MFEFDPADQIKRHAKLVARAWREEEFKRRLKDDPLSVLTEQGVNVPEGTQMVQVLEDTREVKFFVLPTKPPGKFTEDDVQPSLICCC